METTDGHGWKNWRASRVLGGSPGGPEVPPPPSPSSLDSDSDGLPDDWEIAHGFDPRSNQDVTADADSDGLSNLQEYLSGTDPRDAQSVLKLGKSDVKDGRLLIRFTAATGKSYSVQFKGTNSGSVWQRLIDVEATANGRAVEVQDPIATSQSARFYRVVTPKAP